MPQHGSRFLTSILLSASVCASSLMGCDASATNPDDEPSQEDPTPEDPTPDPVVAKGQRQLGISISDRADGDFNLAFTEAVDAGMGVTSLSVSWDIVEVAPGVYAPSPDFIQIAADFYGPRGVSLVLGLNPIDTNNNRLPAHLQGLAWDDPAVVAAYKALLDWVFPKIEGLDLFALSVGNEIDGLLGSDADWAAYTDFFAQVAAHARSLRPGLRVGSKVQLNGLRGPWAERAHELNDLTDLVLTTYYPLGEGFMIEAPTSVAAAFDDVVSRYPERTIAFAEIGAPSTSLCGSSEELQAEFVREAFRAWDRHADQIEMLEFTWMHDISAAALDVYEQYYGVSDQCFLEYLATLGLKGPMGEVKPAWTALETEAAVRGW